MDRRREIRHDGTGLFAGLPSPLTVGRYHSLVAEPASLPAELRPTAWTEDGVLMAFEHVAVSGVRRAVSSRIDSHRRRLRTAGEFSDAWPV